MNLRDEITQMQARLSEMEEELAGETEFEEGQWVYVTSRPTGTEYLVRWTADSIESLRGVDRDTGATIYKNAVAKVRPATKEEVKEALIAEAKRRGYTKDNFKDLDHPHNDGIDSLGYQYCSGDDGLLFRNKTVYCQGQWAEILEDDIVINGHTAEFHEGYVQFGCAKIDKEFFVQGAKEVVKTAWNETGAGNRHVTAIRIGDGLFTAEDITKIAEHYESE